MAVLARERLNVVIAGHVDHGKSTIIGRLLADSGSLPDGKLAAIRELCERTSRPFEYAFLLDALKDERAQGITIDSARVFFKSAARDYIIIDAPGHIEFLKNMVSGASRAQAALLVIDAAEGIRENSRRHGYMLSMLGVRQIAVAVNKMDQVSFDSAAFTGIVGTYAKFLEEIGVRSAAFIPVSGLHGDNVVVRSGQCPWYSGPTVLEALDAFRAESRPEDLPFRMPVQDVYKFTGMGDSRRIVAGTVEAGQVRAGDDVVFYPSGKRTTIRSIESFPAASRDSACSGDATGFTLTEQIYITRGEIASIAGQRPPETARRLRVHLVWLGKHSLAAHDQFFFKLGTSRTSGCVTEIRRVINGSDLSASAGRTTVERNEVAECIIDLDRAIAFDRSDDLQHTGRFVIVTGNDICGGGIVREGLPDKLAQGRDRVIRRNLKWEKSTLASEQRAEKYNQRATLIILTGTSADERKAVAKALEARLFEDGKMVYYLGIGSVRYGLDADLEPGDAGNRVEHIRRLAEVAHILLDAGMILLITAADLTVEDFDQIRTSVEADRVLTAWVGEDPPTGPLFDMIVRGRIDIDASVGRIKRHLQTTGVIFNPW